MHKWFAADEKQVADMISDRDVDRVARFLQRHATALLRIEAVDSEPAEIAARVTYIRDRELQIPGTPMRKHLTQQTERAFSSFAYWRLNRAGRSSLIGRILRPAVQGYATHSFQAPHFAASIAKLAILFESIRPTVTARHRARVLATVPFFSETS